MRGKPRSLVPMAWHIGNITPIIPIVIPHVRTLRTTMVLREQERISFSGVPLKSHDLELEKKNGTGKTITQSAKNIVYI